MSVIQTRIHLPTTLHHVDLVSSLEALRNTVAIRDGDRVGIRKDGRMVVFTGRSFLLHPQQTRRAAQLMDAQPLLKNQRSRCFGDLRAAAHHTKWMIDDLKTQLAAASKTIDPTRKPSTRSLPDGQPSPRPLARPGSPALETTRWEWQRKNSFAKMKRALSIPARPRPAAAMLESMRTRLRHFDALHADQALMRDVATHLQDFANALSKAPAAAKDGLMRVMPTETDRKRIFQDLATKRLAVKDLAPHQTIEVIKTVMLPLQLAQTQIQHKPAEDIQRMQKSMLEELPPNDTRAALAAAIQALAEVHAQAADGRTSKFNKIVIETLASSIFFALDAADEFAAVEAPRRAAEVMALWRRPPV